MSYLIAIMFDKVGNIFFFPTAATLSLVCSIHLILELSVKTHLLDNILNLL